MSILNIEQTRLDHVKNELSKCSDEELEEIANQRIRTSFYLDDKRKLEQRAAYQLLRERKKLIFRNQNG